MFKKQDKIANFGSISETLSPRNFKLLYNNNKAIFYKMENSTKFDIPILTQCIVVDEALHVKLFLNGFPIPLPEWFRKSHECILKSKSILENFSSYISNYADFKEADNELLDEFCELRYKVPDNKPKYTTALLQLTMLLRYTSVQAYKLLLKYLPLPSVSLLKKLCQGGLEPLKAIKLLLNDGKIDENMVLLADEMYLQKCLQ